MPKPFIIALIFASFALLHSALAADRTKALAIRVAGAGPVRAFYRLLYVGLSFVATLAAFYLVASLPDVVIWKPPAAAQAVMSLIQLAGVVLGMTTFSGMDFPEFVGIRQAIKHFKGVRELPGDAEGISQRLVIRGLYGVIRHPLYTAGILIFTFVPIVTRNWLTVSALADLYFIYGALIEERRLLKRFGQDYRDYMKKVPRFIPRIK
ncbi:MAG: isoprenylcysteine carboxylmethyltransferase family protein [Nitrospiraceae bacterium]|nr:isoprenylcysteine carboxylmethyltransferase family protein [Nitrospiraceae bacterium]